MKKGGTWLLFALAAAALLPTRAVAQSAQIYSVQLSALGAQPFGSGFSNVGFGPGFEALIRRGFGFWSVGAGFELTSHTHANGQGVSIVGGFLEPRRVVLLNSERWFPYFSGRLALSSVSVDDGESPATGFTLNVGGGAVIVTGLMGGNRVNIDVGATAGYRSLGVVNRPDPLPDADMGTGANFVARVGVMIGIGD